MTILLGGCQQENKPSQAPASLPAQETKKNPNIYSNSKYGFSFSLCKKTDFEVAENYGGTVVSLLGPYLKDFKQRVAISVIADKVPQNTKLEDRLTESMKTAESNLTNFAITSESDTTIGGVPAKLNSFTYTMNIAELDYTFKDILAVCIKNDTLYAIKYDVPAQLHDQSVDCFNLVLSTFKFY